MTAAGSALAFGWLGWLTSHMLATRFFDHLHLGSAEPAAWSRGDQAGSVGLIACCLALGSLVAVLAGPRDHSAGVRLASVLAAGAFVTADFAERALAGDHAVPSMLVLGIAVGVHTLFAAGASLVWHCCVRALLETLARFEADRGPITARRSAPLESRREMLLPLRWGTTCKGRAPPFAAA